MAAQENIRKQQQEMCDKYNAECTNLLPEQTVGISRNINTGAMPIYGIRHLPVGETSGWYLWAGEKTDEPDFFLSLHIEHLSEYCPLALKFLGLPPGFGFITDSEGYEDVWFEPEYLVE